MYRSGYVSKGPRPKKDMCWKGRGIVSDMPMRGSGGESAAICIYIYNYVYIYIYIYICIYVYIGVMSTYTYQKKTCKEEQRLCVVAAENPL